MRVYQLRFTDRSEAEKVLIEEKVINQDLEFLEGAKSVVWLGTIILTPPIMNEKMEVTQEAVLAEGFHVDLLLEDETKTFVNEIFPNSPKHSFAGFNEQKEVQ